MTLVLLIVLLLVLGGIALTGPTQKIKLRPEVIRTCTAPVPPPTPKKTQGPKKQRQRSYNRDLKQDPWRQRPADIAYKRHSPEPPPKTKPTYTVKRVVPKVVASKTDGPITEAIWNWFVGGM